MRTVENTYEEPADADHKRRSIMSRLRITALVAAAALLALLGATGPVAADRSGRTFSAELEGFQEVPVISSTGSGEFELRISSDESAIEFELSYENLEGTTTLAAHIHPGQRSVNGGVSVFLCGGGGRPPCTPGSGTFTGTITAADVIGPVPQGIAPGELAELVAAMREGVTYVNVHTNKHPGGEIRGQIK